jgi:hypothetical protein
MMDDFKEGQCLERTKLRQGEETYGFLDYTALYWTEHYKSLDSADAGELEERAFEFFTADELSRSFESWFKASEIY